MDTIALDPRLRHAAGWATKIIGTTPPLLLPGEYPSCTAREPVGVVGQIIPGISRC